MPQIQKVSNSDQTPVLTGIENWYTEKPVTVSDAEINYVRSENTFRRSPEVFQQFQNQLQRIVRQDELQETECENSAVEMKGVETDPPQKETLKRPQDGNLLNDEFTQNDETYREPHPEPQPDIQPLLDAIEVIKRTEIEELKQVPVEELEKVFMKLKLVLKDLERKPKYLIYQCSKNRKEGSFTIRSDGEPAKYVRKNEILSGNFDFQGLTITPAARARLLQLNIRINF